MIHLSLPAYHLLATEKTPNVPKQGQYKKSLSPEESLKTFLESRQETGPSADKGDARRRNRTRQNNNRAGRERESNDSTRGETSETPGFPSGLKAVKGHIDRWIDR